MGMSVRPLLHVALGSHEWIQELSYRVRSRPPFLSYVHGKPKAAEWGQLGESLEPHLW